MSYLSSSTARQLADRLDVDEKKVRRILRDGVAKKIAGFPPAPPGQGDEWEVNPDMARYVATYFGER